MNTITVYGISNCDIIKKTLDWYKRNNIPVGFYDYKRSGIEKEKLIQWCRIVGWESLLNKKSTTWRSLPVAEQQMVTDEVTAIRLMAAYTSIIKRPVVEINGKIIVGYDKKYFTNQ